MSYPYLSDVVRALTGLDLPLPFATFGILVACAMFAAAACLTAELRRLYELGALLPGRRLVNGKPIVKPPHELVSNLTMLVLFTGSSARGSSISWRTPTSLRWIHGR